MIKDDDVVFNGLNDDVGVGIVTPKRMKYLLFVFGLVVIFLLITAAWITGRFLTPGLSDEFIKIQSSSSSYSFSKSLYQTLSLYDNQYGEEPSVRLAERQQKESETIILRFLTHCLSFSSSQFRPIPSSSSSSRKKKKKKGKRGGGEEEDEDDDEKQQQ